MAVRLSLVLCLSFLVRAPGLYGQEQNWTNFVGIGAYGLQANNAEAIVRDATKTHVFGIEVDTMRFELPPIERGAVAWVVGN
jgi:hypothetical protein